MYGRVSGIFIKGNIVYAIDSESAPLNRPNWRDGVRIGPLDEDRITAFIPPFEREDRGVPGKGGRRHRGHEFSSWLPAKKWRPIVELQHQAFG